MVPKKTKGFLVLIKLINKNLRFLLIVSNVNPIVKDLIDIPDLESARKRFHDPCSEGTAAIAGWKGQDKNLISTSKKPSLDLYAST